MENKKSKNLEINNQELINENNKFNQDRIVEFLKDFNDGKIKDNDEGIIRFFLLAQDVYSLKPIIDKNGESKILATDFMTEIEKKENSNANALFNSSLGNVKINKDYLKSIINKERFTISDFFVTLFHEREHAKQNILVEKYNEDKTKNVNLKDDYL